MSSPEYKIDNFEDIKNELSKENQTAKEVLEVLEKELKEKYWIEKETKIGLVQEELNDLKKTIKENYNNKDLLKSKLKDKIYVEFVETKLEQDWVSAINLENVTQNIEDPKIIESKKELNIYIDSFTEKYSSFLWKNEREIFKLAISNKIMDAFSPANMLNIWNIMWKVIKWFENWDFSKVETEIDNLWKNATSIKDKVINILTPYDNLLKKVEENLNKWNHINKINIVSNIEWFHNPIQIESYNWEELKFDYEIVKNKELKTEIPSDKIKVLTDYIINSRQKVKNLSEAMKSGNKVRNTALNMLDAPMVGDTIEWALKWLLELPFIGKLIAIFLWLNPENPLESFEKEKKSYKLFKSLKNLWWTKDDNWVITKNNDSKISILSDKDLSELDYEEIKNSLWTIYDLGNWDKEIENHEDLLVKVLSKDWYKWLKINLTDDHFTDNKPNDKFYKIFKEETNKLKGESKDIKKVNVNQIVAEIKAKEEKIKQNNDKLNIDTYTDILITDLAQYKEITIEELIRNKDNLEKFLVEKVWNDKNHEKNKTFASVSKYIIDNIDRYKKEWNIKIDDIYSQVLEDIKKDNDKEKESIAELKKQAELYSAIDKINWDLSAWITVSEGKETLTIKQNWKEIIMNWSKYIVELDWWKEITNITVEWEILKLTWQKNLWILWTHKGTIISSKNKLTNIIYETIQKWKYNDIIDWTNISVTKIV